eukprot:3340837-Pleurochrysis_carterae.AAC.1
MAASAAWEAEEQARRKAEEQANVRAAIRASLDDIPLGYAPATDDEADDEPDDEAAYEAAVEADDEAAEAPAEAPVIFVNLANVGGYESVDEANEPYPLSSEEEGSVGNPPQTPMPPPGQLAADIAEMQAMNAALARMEPEVRVMLQYEMNR